MRKQLAIIGLSAGLVGGGAAGLALTGTAGVAGAQDTTSTTIAPDSSTSTDPATPDRGARLTETLAPLVTDGTTTQAQAQADAVIAALEAAGPGDGDHGPGHGGRRGGFGIKAAATALGLTTDELTTELEAGKTIAAVAAEKGVDLATVTDAMLAAEKEHLAAEVTVGTITQAEADQRLANATERITARVNGTAPMGGHRGGPDRGQPPTDDSTDSGSSDNTTTTEG